MKQPQNHPIQVAHRYEQRDGKGDTIAHVEVKRGEWAVMWLTNLWVDPAHRQQGRAHALLSAVLGDWGDRELYLSVEPYTDQPLSVTQLRSLYRDYGFTETSVPGVMRRPGKER